VIVRELITKLSFDFDDKDYVKFTNAVAEIKKSVSNLNLNLKRTFKLNLRSSNANKGLAAPSLSTSEPVKYVAELSEQTKRTDEDLKHLGETAKKMGDDVKNSFFSVSNVLKSTVGLLISSFSLVALVKSTADAVDELSKLSQQTNISVRDLQILEGVAQRSGVKVGEFTKSFTEFARNVRLTGFAVFKTESKLFKELGVELKTRSGSYRNVFDIYTDVVTKLNSIEDATKRNIYATTLLKTSNVKLLESFGKNREELVKYGQEYLNLAYVIDEEGVASINNFQKSFNNVKIVTKSFFTELAIRLIPTVTKLNSKVEELYVNNKDLISSGITTFANNLSFTLGIVSSLFGTISDIVSGLINHFGGFENFAMILGTLLLPKVLDLTKAFIALNVAMLSNPAFWLKAAITAVSVVIGVLINDIYHWVKGNDSAIGLVLGSWENFKNKFFEIVDSMTSYFKNSFNFLGVDFFKKYFGDKSDLNVDINTKSKSPTNPLKNEPTFIKPLSSKGVNSEVNNKFSFTIENITIGEGSTEEQARDLSRIFYDEFEDKINNEYIKAYGAFG
jgi:hypothetical protein